MPNTPNNNDRVSTLEDLAHIAAMQDKNLTGAKSIQEAYEKISGSITTWNESLTRTVENMDLIIGFQASALEINQNLEIGSKARNQDASLEAELMREIRDRRNQELEAGESIFKQLGREIQLRKEALALEHEKISASYQTGESIAKAATHLEGVMPAILAAIPFGGFLGFLLAGAVKEAQFQSDTQKVVQAWKVVGGGAKEFGSDVEKMLKDFQSEAMASAEDLVAIAHGFTAMGVSAADALSKSGVGGQMLDRMGLNTENIFKTTLALDRLNQVSAGTFSKMASTMVHDFGETLQQATQELITYGVAANDSERNTMQFLGAAMQTTEELKLYAIHLGDVANLTTKISDLNKGQGFNRQYSDQLAQAGMSQVASGIQGMSEGLAAVIGQRVFASMGVHSGDKGAPTGAISALMEFQRGGRDLHGSEQSKFLATTISELGRLAAETGLQGLDREFFMKKMGFGAEGSHVIMELFDKYKDKTGQIDPTKMSDADKEKLNTAMKSESDKTSEVTKLLSSLKIAIADIGNGLLGMILGALKWGFQGLMLLGAEALHHMGVGNFTDSDMASMHKQFADTTNRVAEYSAQFASGVARLGDAAGHAVSIGALSELKGMMLHGAGPVTSQDPKFGELMLKEFQQKDRKAWSGSVHDTLSDQPSWVRSLVGNPNDSGHLTNDAMARLAASFGTEQAAKIAHDIESEYVKRKSSIVPGMKIEHDGLDDIVGFTVKFHRSNGATEFDGGTGRGK